MQQGFTLLSESFQGMHRIPMEYTCDGSNRVPALEWLHAPEGTRSFVIIVDDPDAPGGTFTHWVQYDIPGYITEVDSDSPTPGLSGRNDFHAVGYRGPCPPAQHGEHRYRFTVYALDIESLGLPAGAGRAAIEKAMDPHILGTSRLVGQYGRR